MGVSDLSAASPRAFADRGINANNDSNDDVRSIWSEKSTHIDGQNDLRFWKSNSQHSIASPDDQRHRGPDAPDDSPDRPTTQFSFYSPGLEYAIHASDLNSLAIKHQPVSDLLENGEAGDVWWIDAIAPSVEDIEWLSKVFGIHPLTTEDIGVQETREKIELFGHYYFVSLRSSHPNRRAGGTSWSILNQYALVFRGGIISVTFGPSPHAANVHSRIMEHKSHLALTSDWICYALIDDIVDGFGPSIRKVQQGIETMDDSFAITRPDDISLVLQQIYKCRKEIIRIRRLLTDKTDVIKSFARRCDERCFITPSCEVVVYLSDIQDHVLTMISNLAHSEQMLSGSQMKYVEQLSMDNNRTRNTTLDTLSKLTVLGTMFVPMQALISSFGMNVEVPGQEMSGVAWWFGIIGGLAAVVVVCLALAKLRRWI